MSDCASALTSSSLISRSGRRTNTVATRGAGRTGTAAAIASSSAPPSRSTAAKRAGGSRARKSIPRSRAYERIEIGAPKFTHA